MNHIIFLRAQNPRIIDLPPLAIAVILALAVVGICFALGYAREKDREKKEQQEKEQREKERREKELQERARRQEQQRQEQQRMEAEHKELVKRYAEALCGIARNHAESPYKNLFLRYAPVYQTILGLNRENSRKDIPADFLTEEILMASKNYGVYNALKRGNFLPPYVEPDLRKIRMDAEKKAQKVENRDLRIQAEAEEGTLEQDRERLPYRKMLADTEPLLTMLIENAERQDKAACIRLMRQTQDALNGHGCRILFSDDKIVLENESLEAEFRDSRAVSVPLPGLYVFVRGNYALLNGCGGVRRLN